MRYAPLHNHTIFSIKDAIAHPEGYVNRIHEYNRSQDEHEIVALAVSEHGNMFSTVRAHVACNNPNGKDKRTLKPIYANEIYHVDDLSKAKEYKYDERYHLLLLAKDDEGLKNLIKITTHSGLNKIKSNTKEFQLTTLDYIKQHGKGVIGLSACMGGKIGRLLIQGEYDEAKALAIELSMALDEFYLEIQPHDTLPEQMLINNYLLQIHQETGIPMVITSDSHYVLKEDKKYHDLMKEIDHMSPFTVDAHLWTPDELIEWCNQYGYPLSCIENTAIIADKCTADITPKDPRGLMPDFPCPTGFTEDSYLTKLAHEGLKRRIIENKHIKKNFRTYFTRILYELDIITQMGFSGYFLILWDWFKFCKDNRILLGPGRGSAAGSLVAYVLDITKIDPIKNDLIFERFLNPERIEFPDVDTDISKVDRPKAIKYLKGKYGEDHVCQIITFGQYKLKNTIKAVLSAERGFTADYQNSITKTIPDMIGGQSVTYELLEYIALTERGQASPNQKFDEIYEEATDRDIRRALDCYDTLQQVFKENPEVLDAITHLRGAISQTGIHAGGVVVSSKKIGEHIPLMKGSDTAVLHVCQADMGDVTFFNALKIDALGLKTLSQIRLCMDLAGIPEEWLDDEDTNDADVYKFLREGNTANVFQMHKPMPTSMIRDFNVTNLEGLTAVNAGNRPGPLAKGDDGKSMVEKYIEVVNGGEMPSYDHRIDHVLAPTNGMLWYQEQLQEIGRIVAGYSLGASDIRIRKTLGKKQVSKIPEIREEFVYGTKTTKYEGSEDVIEPSKYCVGAKNNTFDIGMALSLFKDMEDFAKYCFNKSHSAAYGVLAYQTAYLSFYYPVEWAVACMTIDSMDGSAKDKITATLNACKKRQIKILAPDINKSKQGFSVEVLNGDKVIRYGLLAVKDVGIPVINAINKLIEIDGEFKSFDDFLDRTFKNNDTLRNLVGLNDKGKFSNPFSKRNVEPLIKVGAFDSLEENRYKLLNQYADYRKDKNDRLDESEYKLKHKLEYELEILGSYVSQHPLDNESVFPYVDVDRVKDNAKIKIAGIFKKLDRCTSKSNKVYYRMTIEAKDGKLINISIFDRLYTKHPESIAGLQGKKAKEGKEIIIVQGKWSTKWGLTASNVNRIMNKANLTKKEATIPEPSEEAPVLMAKDSPIDNDLFLEVVS